MKIAYLVKEKGCRGYEFVDRKCRLVEIDDVEFYFAILKADGYTLTSSGEDGHWEAYKICREYDRGTIVTTDTSYFDNRGWLDEEEEEEPCHTFTEEELERLKNGEELWFDCCTFEDMIHHGVVTDAYMYRLENGAFSDQTYYYEAFVPALGIKAKFGSYN